METSRGNVVNTTIYGVTLAVYEYTEDGSLHAYATATLQEREIWRREVPWNDKVEMLDAATDAFAQDFAAALANIPARRMPTQRPEEG